MSRQINSMLAIVLCILSTIARSDALVSVALAPLLTRLAPWGTAQVNRMAVQFSQNFSPSTGEDMAAVHRLENVAAASKLVTKDILPTMNAKSKVTFGYDAMLQDYKTELVEYVFAKSLERGFTQ